MPLVTGGGKEGGKEDWVKEQGRKSWATAPPRRARCTVGKVHYFPRPRILWGFVLPHRMQETLCLNQCLQKTCISGLGCRKLLQAEWIHIEFPLTWFQGPCSVSEGLDVFMIMSHNRLCFSFTCVSFCLGLLWCFLNSTLMSQHLTPIHAELVIRHLKKVVCIYSVHVQAQWCHCCYWLVWIYCVCVWASDSGFLHVNIETRCSASYQAKYLPKNLNSLGFNPGFSCCHSWTSGVLLSRPSINWPVFPVVS